MPRAPRPGSLPAMLVALTLAALPATAPAQTAAPADADADAVVAAARDYFAARARGDTGAALALVSELYTDRVPAGTLTEAWRAADADGLDYAEMEIRALTWYLDPTGLPEGAYATLDLSGNSEDVALACGYQVWQRTPDGAVLVREELNLFPAEGYAEMDELDRSEILAAFGCY
ncbi:hypothetical protein HKCCE2091_00595 [Rhodobacterales bacterium HKCCE2091]|nr:hypothetical protein [Rhodobacterales bacterium HKCCE2091]